MPDDLEIRAWETDEPCLVVWGTHDSRKATEVAKEYYETEVGEVPELLFWHLCLAAGMGWGRFYGSPELIDMEVWPKHLISYKEPVEGWVPYLVVQW